MWKERINKLNFLVLCLLACFPVINTKVTVVLIISFTAISALSGFVWGIKSIERKQVKELVLLLIPFGLIFFRTYITDRSDNALFYLEVSMSLLAFPAAFFLSPATYTQKQKDVLSLMFVLSTAAIILFGEIQAALQLAADCGPGKFWPNRAAVFSDPAFTYHFRTIFEEQTSIHPTYASIFLGISIILILDYFLKSFHQRAIRSNAFILTVIILFIFLQSLLASRTPFIATMFCSVVLIFIYLKRKIFALYVLGGLIILSVLLIFMVPSFSSRFREISVSNTSVPSTTNENSFNIRVGIYQCSRDVISENWIWGVGPGNVQDKLNDCYADISKEVYDQKNYNTHNQFMDYWAGLGILGPVSLIIILLYTSIRNYRIKNPLALCISLLFIIAMMTENLLSRQNGIVCFAYFTSLYFFSPRRTF